jgi:hypothetical protein
MGEVENGLKNKISIIMCDEGVEVSKETSIWRFSCMDKIDMWGFPKLDENYNLMNFQTTKARYYTRSGKYE